MLSRTSTSSSRRTTRFIGREREIAALRARVAEASPVVVLGPPGVGKTRLAQEYALRHREDHPGGAWMVDLSDVASVDGICSVIGAALDVPLISGTSEEMVQQLAAAIALRGRALVLLDNFEHLVRYAGATVGEIQRRAPEACLLVTSRARLHLSGEALFELGPLPLPADAESAAASEAVQLFADRARSFGCEHAVAEHEMGRVAALVRELEGNPLAIELAAARLRLLTTTELLDSLVRPLDLYARNAADAPSRHASLPDAIAWSFRLLEPWEQAALTQCAVFRGGFDARAAIEVLDLEMFPGAPPIIEVLQSLRDNSLLTREEPHGAQPRARFRLPVGVRELSWAELEARGGAASAQVRHLRHFLHEARRWHAAMNGPGEVEARRSVVLEMENLLAAHGTALKLAAAGAPAAAEAMEISLALRPVLALRGPCSLLLALLDDALSAPGASAAPERLRTQVLEARAEVNRLLGRNHAAEADARAALAMAERLNDVELIGLALVALASFHNLCSRFVDAEEALSRALGLGVLSVRGRALNHLGWIRWATGDFAEASETLEAALRVHRELGDLSSQAVATLNLGYIEIERGRLDAASMHCEHARALCSRLSDRRRRALVVSNQAMIAHGRGDVQGAERLYAEALQTLREVGVRRHEGICLDGLGMLYEATGRPREALACYEAARSQLSGTGGREENAVLNHLGRLAAREGHIEVARLHFEAADRIGAAASVRLAGEACRAHLDLALARAALVAGDREQAERHVSAARSRVSGARPAHLPTEAKLALDLARRELEVFEQEQAGSGAEGAAPAAAPSGELVVSADGRSVRLPSGAPVRIGGKVRHLFNALALARRERPGAALSIEELFQAGWPGEKVQADAGVKRVYTAIWSLRKLGLTELVLSDRDGYLLDPAVPLRVAGER